MNINSSSLYSMGGSNSSNAGLSGLASGMDTEAMVQKMLAGMQGKIDKQQALRQQTVWKQDIYQDVISSVSNFYNKYFDTLYGSTLETNFANASFFDSMKSAVTSGNAVKLLSTGSGAAAGDLRVAVKNLATSAALKSDSPMSGNQTITGTVLDEAELGKQYKKEIVLKIGDNETVAVSLTNVTTEQGMVDSLNNALQHSSGGKGVTAKMFEGKLRFVTDSPDTKIMVDNTSTAAGLKMTGLSRITLSDVTGPDGTVTGKMLQADTRAEPATGYTFDMTLDGIKKTITLNAVGDAMGNVTADSLHKALSTEVKKAFGDYVDVNLTADKRLEFSVNIKGTDGKKETGHELVITGMDTAAHLGVTPGASTRMNSGTKLSALGAGGDRFAFTINGTKFSFNGDDTVGTVLNAVNNSGSGVRLTYSSMADTFKLEATSTGAKYGIDLSQQEGNLLGVMFGTDKVAAADKRASGYLTTDTVSGTAFGDPLPGDFAATSGESMKFTVNGKSYSFSLSKLDEGKTHDLGSVEQEFNTFLAKTFGPYDADGKPTAPANISYSAKDGKMTVADGFTVEFAATKVDLENGKAVAEGKKTDLALALGLNRTANSNIAGADTPLDQIYKLQGVDLSTVLKSDGTQAQKLSDIASIGGYTATYSEGRISLTGSGEVDPSANPALKAIFGTDKFKLSDGKTSANAIAQGEDAVVVVNGVETSRSSNTFIVDDITLALTQESTTHKNADGTIAYDETIISTTRDTDKVVKGFKSFVDDYNAMIKKLNGYTGEKSDYREYAPLTDAQKKEMSDKEIELWEEKAKTGLVRNDDTIGGFLSEMRMALYTKPEGSRLALYNIGIETTKDYHSNGALQFDEAALRNALAADPDSVKALFTSAEGGLSSKLVGTLKAAVNPSLGSAGSLVKLAGIKDDAVTEKNNTMYRNLTSIDDRIKELKARYEKQKAHYWSQFNSMESALNNFNSQSQMLSQQFGGL